MAREIVYSLQLMKKNEVPGDLQVEFENYNNMVRVKPVQ